MTGPRPAPVRPPLLRKGRRWLPALALSLFAGSAYAAQDSAQDCRLALALALDVSGSVDPRDQRPQAGGGLAGEKREWVATPWTFRQRTLQGKDRDR